MCGISAQSTLHQPSRLRSALGLVCVWGGEGCHGVRLRVCGAAAVRPNRRSVATRPTVGPWRRGGATHRVVQRAVPHVRDCRDGRASKTPDGESEPWRDP